MHGLRKLYKLLISRHHRILANDNYAAVRLLADVHAGRVA